MILGDEQVSCTVVVVIAGDDGAGIFELNFVESDVSSDVLEAVRAEIAEQADFAFAVFRFSDGNKINPAVVVVIERGERRNP